MRLTLALFSCLCAGAQAFRDVGLYSANAVFAAGMVDRGDKPEVQGLWRALHCSWIFSVSKCPGHS